MQTSSRSTQKAQEPVRVRRSPIHGTGVFATRAIRKGERIMEYRGERITHEEADRRYADKADDDNHTFLFTVDNKTVIDGGAHGNSARYINHGCDPNCESILDDGRVFIEATRNIVAGEELVYDYNIGRSKDDPPNADEIFGCRCGAATCRGTMLEPKKKPKSRKSKVASSRKTPRSPKRAKVAHAESSRSRPSRRARA